MTLTVHLYVHFCRRCVLSWRPLFAWPSRVSGWAPACDARVHAYFPITGSSLEEYSLRVFEYTEARANIWEIGYECSIVSG